MDRVELSGGGMGEANVWMGTSRVSEAGPQRNVGYWLNI